MEKTLKETRSPLLTKKVRVVPVRRPGGWLPSGHDGDFMYTGTTFKIGVPKKNGLFVDPLKDLSAAEIEFIAERLNRKPADFNIYSNTSFWATFEVKLDKNVTILDLSQPIDYLRWKVLLTNSDLIAPSGSQKHEKGTYRFAVIDDDEEVIEKVKKADKKKEAYKELGKMEASDTRLRDFLRVYGISFPLSTTKDWMVAKIEEIIDNNIDEFLTITRDSKFEQKLFVSKALDTKALVKTGKTSYALPGGEEIGRTLEDTINYLFDPKNSDIFYTVKARIEAGK